MNSRQVAATTAEATVPAEQRLKLPLLRERLEAIPADRRESWLDLGRVQPILLERLSDGPHRLVVGGVALQAMDDDPPLALPDRAMRAEVFDVLLSWDWLNHLDADALRRLGAELARNSAPGAVLHALIFYSTDAMPPEPVDYRLTSEGEVRSPVTVPGSRPAPRYSPKALEKAMPHWQVDRTLLLNNGMQEFMLRRRDDIEA